MITVCPDYYEAFHCIADRCRHSCCEGWEIDIDEDTAELYSCTEGKFGNELRSSMETDENGNFHFILNEKEQCPFLQTDGLCRLILTIGEENLCDICREHPRFYNYYGEVEETGIGLCCEEAVRLLLSSDLPVKYIVCNENGTDNSDKDLPDIILQKKEILSVLHSSGFSFADKLTACEKICYCKHPEYNSKTLLPLFLQMEIMNPAWNLLLLRLAALPAAFEIEHIPDDSVSEKLFEYFVYRHFKPGSYSADQILAFCLAGVLMTRALDQVDDDMEEHIRLYSSEIEYCEENIDILMNVASDGQ